jgi:hypothetical protein
MSSTSQSLTSKRDLTLSEEECVDSAKRPRISDKIVDSDTVPVSAKKRSKKKRKRIANFEAGSREDVFWHETLKILGKQVVDSTIAEGLDWDAPFNHREELEVTVSCLSSNGRSLSALMYMTILKLNLSS